MYILPRYLYGEGTTAKGYSMSKCAKKASEEWSCYSVISPEGNCVGVVILDPHYITSFKVYEVDGEDSTRTVPVLIKPTFKVPLEWFWSC